MVDLAHAAGVIHQGDVDCIVAVAAGLIEAQIADDPTGDRGSATPIDSSTSWSMTH